jgi:hypothetical protein
MADVTEQHGMFAALQVQQLSKDINALNKTLDKDLDVRNVVLCESKVTFFFRICKEKYEKMSIFFVILHYI